MKKKMFLSTDEMEKHREQIVEEIGEDVMNKLSKAMTVLAAAMLKRAEYHAQAQLRGKKSKDRKAPEQR
ncbi:MAG TPA: hypothetical protein VKX49_04740 [Bryobacteraceae bacterium]|nr:hypothetical protein [Bryobacteraceae bacterium]